MFPDSLVHGGTACPVLKLVDSAKGFTGFAGPQDLVLDMEQVQIPWWVVVVVW